ncbi:hypothetical protein [Chryseobacterium defluvii]|uniref:Uncharacterized protein n=1 Tax=Chryseobacterium defluvii TaxID=160396 RepID=A0A495SNJ3_9FLAO|nr:hypothetical protein [Chryseobacterium defluvii]RKT01813.1 hypothetical protein BCF58_1038 [Chryseobacterium defluvii]
MKEEGQNIEIANTSSKVKLNSEKVVKILEKYGTSVSLEEAGIILEFLRKLADVAVNQYIAYRKRKE